MELDDLKQNWGQEGADLPEQKIKDYIRMSNTIEKSKNGIRKTFQIEICIIASLYFAFLVLVVVAGSRVESYMYKLVAATLMGMIPIAYRLFKSQQMIVTLDYSKDIKSNLVNFLKYYKASLLLYRWTSYIMTLILFVLFFTDKDFLRLENWLKAAIASYLISIFIMTGPYIKKLYAKKVSSIESFIKE